MPRSKFKISFMCIGLLASHLFVGILVAVNVRSEDGMFTVDCFYFSEESEPLSVCFF